EEGEAKERRRISAECQLDGAEPLFDFLDCPRVARRLGLALLLDPLWPGLASRRQVGMRPGVSANRMPSRGDLLEDFRVPQRVLADGKKSGFDALLGQRIEYRTGIAGPGTVVEGQHHFLQHQEIVLFVLFEAEAGSPGGVDFDRSRQTQRI